MMDGPATGHTARIVGATIELVHFSTMWSMDFRNCSFHLPEGKRMVFSNCAFTNCTFNRSEAELLHLMRDCILAECIVAGSQDKVNLEVSSVVPYRRTEAL